MYFPYPFPYPPYFTHEGRMGRPNKRSGKKNKEANFMRIIHALKEFDANKKEIEEWIKSKEKKEEKKEAKMNTAHLTMLFFALSPLIGLTYIYIAAGILLSSYNTLQPILQHIK